MWEQTMESFLRFWVAFYRSVLVVVHPRVNMDVQPKYPKQSLMATGSLDHYHIFIVHFLTQAQDVFLLLLPP